MDVPVIQGPPGFCSDGSAAGPDGCPSDPGTSRFLLECLRSRSRWMSKLLRNPLQVSVLMV